ncbi:proton-conducting transporter membrane subunit [Streptomyces sp. CBMA152]|uniref:proton-conducting transporter transmembrane domain-containing protein n=1 Tax=Streptomyces sp. CBMA152 TaxID=1896312 RepID=UPI001CB70E9D|nr:proton-conducting transporter membrane subunit [Streptomyces sp. CBMA152]
MVPELLLTAPVVVPLGVAGVYAVAAQRADARVRIPAARVPLPAAMRRARVASGPNSAPPAFEERGPGRSPERGAGAAGPARGPGAEPPGTHLYPPPGRPPRAFGKGWGGGGYAGLVAPGAILGSALALAHRAHPAVSAYGDTLRADALTVWMLLVVGAVAALAVAAGPAYLAGERAAGRAADRTAHRYHLLVHAFLAAMCLAVLAGNLGVLWVAVEATTVVTAFLVGHRRTRTSVEAAWKYVVICSAGIALAFLGTVLVYYAARQAGIPEAGALDWHVLVAHADRLDPDVTRLGIALVALGYGAKAGLVPLHAWLPDAHSQAPAPVSALMSGVLLAVSFTAVLRYKVIADAALGPGFVRALLATAALLTLALAAGLLLAQRDYKRMLAYSSMEHMGLIALGAAVGGPLATAAVLLHIAGHGLAKTVAFCASGQLLQLRRTSRIGRVRGLIAWAPGLGTALALAVVALLGLPPFALFASELALARAGFAAGMGVPVTAALALALAAYAALAVRTARMLLGPAPDGHASSGTDTGPGTGAATPLRIGPASGAPLALGLFCCAALGLTVRPLAQLLTAAAHIAGGQ